MTSKDEKNQPTESFEEALAKFKKNLTADLDDIFDEEAIKARKAQKGRRVKQQELPRLEVANFGVVASFTLPPGWVESSFSQGEAQQSRSRIFHDSDSPSVQLCFFFRGHRVSEQAAREFLDLLSRPDHFLKPSEFKAAREIVRDLGNTGSFKLLQAATRQLNGKRVMIVEGRFVQSEQDTYALFVDVDGTGTIVQEIHYQAPKLDYARHLAVVKAAMESIAWRVQ
jgi:hypothetical protein